MSAALPGKDVNRADRWFGLIILRAGARERDSWLSAGCIFLALLFWDIWRSYPAFPAEVALELTLPTGIANRVEPLVVTGSVGKCSSLAIAYSGTNTAAFLYSSNGTAWQSQTLTYEPGAKVLAKLRMPSLAAAGSKSPASTGSLWLSLNEHIILQAEVPFHPCPATDVYFGEDPAGGPAVGVQFRGQIRNAAGRPVRGRPDALFSTSAKPLTWLRTRFWHVPVLVLASILITLLARACLKSQTRAEVSHAWLWDAMRRHRWFIVVSTLNVWLFTWLMTGGEFRMIYPDAFGAYYDFQAQSLLQGRFDVAPETLGGEGFIIDGKAYSYFGIVPALIRLPFVFFNVGFGHLTRWFMVAYFVGCMAGAYALLQLATARTKKMSSSAPSGLAVVLMLTATGGSSLLFLGSRAYVYHEVILCGVAFALWSTYFSMRYVTESRRRWWLSALILGIVAVHSRPPVGLFALGVLACTAALRTYLHRNHRLPALAISAIACMSFFSLNGLAYLKFGTIDAVPYKYHVQYSPERVAKIEGRSFHLVNLPHNLSYYLFTPGFEMGGRFPGFRFDLTKRPIFENAKIDLEEATASVAFAMLGLLLLSVAGVLAALKFTDLRHSVAVVTLSALPLAACMFTFIATSHRYTADFCPPLIALSAFGVALLDTQRPSVRFPLLTAAAMATAFSVLLTLGLALHFQSELVWGVPDEIIRAVRGFRD